MSAGEGGRGAQLFERGGRVLEEGAGLVAALLVDQPGGEVGLRDGVPVRVAERVEPVDRFVEVMLDSVVVRFGGVQ